VNRTACRTGVFAPCPTPLGKLRERVDIAAQLTAAAAPIPRLRPKYTSFLLPLQSFLPFPCQLLLSFLLSHILVPCQIGDATSPSHARATRAASAHTVYGDTLRRTRHDGRSRKHTATWPCFIGVGVTTGEAGGRTHFSAVIRCGQYTAQKILGEGVFVRLGKNSDTRRVSPPQRLSQFHYFHDGGRLGAANDAAANVAAADAERSKDAWEDRCRVSLIIESSPRIRVSRARACHQEQP
jgi:hypothetical protein